MKHIFFLLIFLALSISSAFAEKRDSTTITINNTNYTIHVGDSVVLGYGANPDGSFMHVFSGIDTPMDKINGGKKVVIKKIQYIKATNQIQITIRGKTVYHLAYIPQAIDKLEIISINGLVFY